jgi:hypothetical protein
VGGRTGGCSVRVPRPPQSCMERGRPPSTCAKLLLRPPAPSALSVATTTSRVTTRRPIHAWQAFEHASCASIPGGGGAGGAASTPVFFAPFVGARVTNEAEEQGIRHARRAARVSIARQQGLVAPSTRTCWANFWTGPFDAADYRCLCRCVRLPGDLCNAVNPGRGKRGRAPCL